MQISPVLIVLLIFIFITTSLGVRIVPQGKKFVVQRFGKFRQVLNPGLNFIIPYIDVVSHRVPSTDLCLDIPQQEVITKDNAVVFVNAISFINIISPEKAVFGIDNYTIAIQNLIQTTLRSIVGSMSLDECLSNRDVIKSKLKTEISDDVMDWGIVVKSVEIQDIKPSPTMQKSMEDQAAAERDKRAMITRAEGNKQKTITEAEGKLEAAEREAKAKILLADASEQAISKVANALKNGDLPIQYLLGEKYIEALGKITSSENTKIVLLPGDLPAAIRGIMGGLKG